MNQVVEAVFESGVFQPLQPVDLRDHERVTLIVQDHLALDHADAELAELLDTPYDLGVRSTLSRAVIYDETD